MSISIPCPQCGAVLRLRDTSLLGKKGKCPRCEHKFELQLPDEDEVELEVAAPPPPHPGVVMGTGATWVPDHAPTTAPVAPAQAAEFPGPPLSVGDSTDTLQKFRRRRRKKWTAQQWAIALAVLILVGVGGGVAYNSLAPSLQTPADPVAQGGAKKAPAARKKNAAANPEEAAEPVVEGVVAGRPTKGEPLDLLWTPSGTRIIINLHPAKLWKAGGLGEGEFVAALGPLGKWAQTAIKDLTYYEVGQIERLQVCLIPGARGTPPDLAARVTLLEGAKKSDLLEKFGGERKDANGRVFYAAQNYAYTLIDAQENRIKTFAMCSTALAAEMVQSAENPNPTDAGIEGLLPKTDRDLDASIVCTPTDLRIHAEFLVPQNAQDLLQHTADWIAGDDEVEAVSWSCHLTDKNFYTELLARNRPIAKPHLVAKSYSQRLAETPWRLYDNILQYMHPAELGQRRLIGRLPSMTQTVFDAAKVEAGDRLVKVSYQGPERAGPNLAVATLLAWDESTRTNFSSQPTTAVASSGNKTPDKLSDRLKTKIDVDFRNTPLEDAFLYIAGEANFNMVVDGDALKLAAITKNETQNYQAEKISAAEAMLRIRNRPDKKATYGSVCFLYDEEKKQITVTTLQKAEQLKQKPYDLKP